MDFSTLFPELAKMAPEVALVLIVLYFMYRKDQMFIDSLKDITRVQERTADAVERTGSAVEKLDEHLTRINGSHKRAWERQASMMQEVLKSLQERG